MFPLDNLSEKLLHLNTFFWIENERPQNKSDVFKTYPKIERPKGGGIDSLGSSDTDNSSQSASGSSENQKNSTNSSNNSPGINSRTQLK